MGHCFPMCTLQRSISQILLLSLYHSDLIPTALSKTCRDSITGRDAETAALRAFLFQCGWCLAFYLCYILFTNSNSNINRHVLLPFIETELAR